MTRQLHRYHRNPQSMAGVAPQRTGAGTHFSEWEAAQRGHSRGDSLRLAWAAEALPSDLKVTPFSAAQMVEIHNAIPRKRRPSKRLL